ncbi:TPA: hypothetical protein IVC08_24260 [Escherichia coli]|nr:hypothetical protein [Escherichia coli]EFN4117313.1 hypothetical protein [Escherichia coli]EFT3194540.1 hypothetical protein [Escherichia coli]EHB7552406.1 hypothetical protein [Escherichia coli]HAP6025057.1 hypothetical protein [Escherichia coli]
MEKNEVKTTLRYPYRFKEEVKRIAKEEGMSENSVLVQGLAWWLKYREKMRNLYLDNLEATGLYQVPLSSAQPGDVLLCCFGSLSSTGVLFSSTLFNPSTGPSTGPSLMASITLSSCVDFRLSFASRGVCPLLLPLPIPHAP